MLTASLKPHSCVARLLRDLLLSRARSLNSCAVRTTFQPNADYRFGFGSSSCEASCLISGVESKRGNKPLVWASSDSLV